jgi:hypothetical protein
LLATALLQRQYVSTDHHAGNGAALFFIMLFECLYGFFIDPTQIAFASEIFPTTIRAKGIGLAFCSYFIGALVYTEAAPTAFKNIGWKMYMVWFACNIVSTVGVYFLIPETKLRNMEEIGDLFGDEVVVHLAKDGHVIEQEKILTNDYPPNMEHVGEKPEIAHLEKP